MKILIDIGHPAHVHLFKHFAWEMINNGHLVLFTVREKELEKYLLKKYHFNFVSLGKKYKSNLGKFWGLIKFDFLEIFESLRFKPDIFLSHGSMYAAHTSGILCKPHISLEDTFNFEQIRLYLPFTNTILTSDYQHGLNSKKVLKYSGYHELAYLHPNRFKPDRTIFSSINLLPNEKYVLIRFIAWNATHDIGHCGLNENQKSILVQELSKYAKVFISSEDKLPRHLQSYHLPVKPEDVHSLIYFSSLIFGESATMVSEGAVLGVPGILVDNKGRYYTSELEQKYGLVYNFKNSEAEFDRALMKAIEILKDPSTQKKYLKRQQALFRDKIDVTAFLVWFIENYPESRYCLERNPEYQKKFLS